MYFRKIPQAVRMAFHDCVGGCQYLNGDVNNCVRTGDLALATPGGCNGCIDHTHPDNAG